MTNMKNLGLSFQDAQIVTYSPFTDQFKLTMQNKVCLFVCFGIFRPSVLCFTVLNSTVLKFSFIINPWFHRQTEISPVQNFLPLTNCLAPNSDKLHSRSVIIDSLAHVNRFLAQESV